MTRCVATLLTLLPASSNAANLPWETWQDLRELALVGGAYGSYLASSYCLDGCRYDRTSIDPGRGGQRFLRIDATVDGDEAVLFEQPGAGAVTRIWMTTGDGISQPLPADVRLRVYLDGAAEPTIDTPLDEWFAAPVPMRGVLAPLAGDRDHSSGGNVSYVPIAYRDGIRIALLHGANRRLWYQLNYTQLADASAVTSYRPQQAFAELGAALSRPWVEDLLIARTRPAGRGRAADTRLAPHDAAVATLTAARPLVLLRQSGAGWLRMTRIQLERARWADVTIAFAFDGETTVELPIADFFAADALGPRNPRGLFNGVDANDAFYSQIPMPFRRSVEVALHLRAGTAALPVRSLFAVDAATPPARAGTFRTHAVAACPTTPASSGDTVLLAHEGSGRLIGLAAWMTGDGVRTGGYYLEGDERLYIDGSVQPLWYGTGVEDLFNGGFYFDHGEFVAPMAGATLRHAGGTDDATSMYRWFLTDAPSWHQSIVFKLENGALGNEPLCLRTVAYFFARPQPTQAVIATLQVGDAASEAAAQYRAANDAQCVNLTATFGDEPPTARSAVVCRGTTPSRFVFAAPRAGRAFRLRRTFDAGISGQAAEVWVNGAKVAAWPDVQANPTRRWSQMDLDFLLPQAASVLNLEIRPRSGRSVTESRYELWGAVEGD